MTPVDWIIIGFTLLFAIWGFAQGLIVGALSLAGFAGGAFLGARFGPLLLAEGSSSPYAPLFGLVGALLLGGILASGFESIGFTLRRRMGERLGVVDGLGGAVLLGCLALALAWLVGAVALQTPGARDFRGDIQRSAILSSLNDTLPPSGPVLNAIARFDPFPELRGPEPDVEPPSSAIARDPDVREASGSVVKVLGTACGLGVQGSGWVAAPGIVVTNAHVIAGQDDTMVQPGGRGPSHDAQAIWYDPHNDLAILRAPGISNLAPLPLHVQAPTGTSAAIVGFPQNGPLDVQPGRLGETEVVSTEDAYGRGPVRRRITLLRGLVRSGNSGGPMIDGRGRVVTTIFAARANGARSGFGVPDSIVKDALARADDPVGTGPCAR